MHWRVANRKARNGNDKYGFHTVLIFLAREDDSWILNGNVDEQI